MHRPSLTNLKRLAHKQKARLRKHSSSADSARHKFITKHTLRSPSNPCITPFSSRSSSPKRSRVNSQDRLLVKHPTPASCPDTLGPDRCLLADNYGVTNESVDSGFLDHSITRSTRLPRSKAHTLPHVTHSSLLQGTSSPLSHPVPHSSFNNTKTLCRTCTRSLKSHEIPSSPPSKKCRHENCTCAYCLHESIKRAVEMVGWEGVRCPQCGVRMEVEETLRGVLLWDVRVEGRVGE